MVQCYCFYVSLIHFLSCAEIVLLSKTIAQTDNMSGSMHGMIIFSLGVYMGIISSAAGKKREVDKLKELLKQTENLVQDLQEELEMKDSLIVKELANEIYGSQDTHRASFLDAASSPFSCEQREGDISKEVHNPRTGESMDSMSKIEAELEAELERLGLNVGLSNAQVIFRCVIMVQSLFMKLH